MFEIEYSHEDNSDWFNIVKDLDEFLLYNLSEPSSYFPLLGDISPDGHPGFDHHSLSPTSIFFHVSKLKDRNIHVICPDINYLVNFKTLQNKISFKSKITLHSYPWFFLNQYFSNNLYEKKDIDIDILHKAIFLSGGKKLCRLHIIKELKKYENFLYSNMGYYGDLISTSNEITECYLDDEYFNIKINNNQEMRVTGDFNIGNLNFKYDDFDTNERIYYPPSKSDYKYIHKMDFKQPYCLYEIVPEEYFKSAISFFCETQTLLTSHLTEKTIKNLYYKKPFLGFACKGYYKFLVDNGFELYDELFDYSFDEYSYGNRLNNYIGECKKVLDLSLDESINLVEKLKPKILHNYENCKNILKTSMLNIDQFDVYKHA
jgi:hypothetical protein